MSLRDRLRRASVDALRALTDWLGDPRTSESPDPRSSPSADGDPPALDHPDAEEVPTGLGVFLGYTWEWLEKEGGGDPTDLVKAYAAAEDMDLWHDGILLSTAAHSLWENFLEVHPDTLVHGPLSLLSTVLAAMSSQGLSIPGPVGVAVAGGAALENPDERQRLAQERHDIVEQAREAARNDAAAGNRERMKHQRLLEATARGQVVHVRVPRPSTGETEGEARSVGGTLVRGSYKDSDQAWSVFLDPEERGERESLEWIRVEERHLTLVKPPSGSPPTKPSDGSHGS